MKSSVVKRSIVVDGRKTSVCLEDSFWSSLKEIARSGRVTLSELVSRVKSQQAGYGNLSSALRVHILAHYRDRDAASTHLGEACGIANQPVTHSGAQQHEETAPERAA